jgi:hypothetical protein
MPPPFKLSKASIGEAAMTRYAEIDKARETLARPPFTARDERREGAPASSPAEPPPVERRVTREIRKINEFHAGLERERRQSEREEKREQQHQQRARADDWNGWCDGRIANALADERRSVLPVVAEHVAELKAEIAELKTQIEEMRKAVNSEQARVIDLPNMLQRRTA